MGRWADFQGVGWFSRALAKIKTKAMEDLKNISQERGRPGWSRSETGAGIPIMGRET
jgi:hypothetical protein